MMRNVPQTKCTAENTLIMRQYFKLVEHEHPDEEIAKMLRAATQRTLSNRQLQILKDYAINGMLFEDIARKYEINVGTVSVIMRRARSNLLLLIRINARPILQLIHDANDDDIETLMQVQ